MNINLRPMKEITKTLLPLLLLVLVTATSCGKDEPDGTSDKMQWKAPTDLVQVLEGVYQVPLSGGSFTFICENCEPKVESLYERGPHVSYETPGPSHYIEGVWSSVQCKKKKVTITFSPTTEDEPRVFDIGFTAGDMAYYMHFLQRNRLY